MSTQTFLPPGESVEVVSSVTKTMVFPDDLPVPNSVNSSKSKLRKRRRSSFSTPMSERDKEMIVSTPTKRARVIFEKLERGEELSEREISKELGASLSAFVTRGESEALEIALSEGANPNWNRPVTPLYTAVDLNLEDYSKLLLSYGSSIIKKNAANDNTPVSLAMKNPGSKLYNLFISHIHAMESVYEKSDVLTRTETSTFESTPLRADNFVISDELMNEIDSTKPNYTLNCNFALDKKFETKSFCEMIKLPPSALQGLTKRADEKLGKLKIKTIEDLGNWKYYKLAKAIAALASIEEPGKRNANSESNLNRALDKEWETKSLNEILKAPLSAFQGLANWVDNELGNNIQPRIKSIQNLASWKYCRWAESMVTLAKYENADHSSR